MPRQVFSESGRISICSCYSLAPFFADAIADKFFAVRTDDRWRRFVDHTDNLDLSKGQNLMQRVKSDRRIDGSLAHFEMDDGERRKEATGYHSEVFRGILFNDYLTPIYRVSNGYRVLRQLWSDRRLSKLKGTHERRRALLHMIIGEAAGRTRDWTIKLKLTKSGLATVFLYLEVDGKADTATYRDRVRGLAATPYDKEGYKNRRRLLQLQSLLQDDAQDAVRKDRQLFTSYLHVVSICVIHVFLARFRVHEEVEKVLGPDIVSDKVDANGDEVSREERASVEREAFYLKSPWAVRYSADAVIGGETPPLRNYCIAYHLNDVSGSNGRDVHWLFRHKEFGKQGAELEKKAFVETYGDVLISMLNTAYVRSGPDWAVPPFTGKVRDSLFEKDMARWRSGLFYVDSESVLILSPSGVDYTVGGVSTSYDDYWYNIVKVLFFLVGCKTLLQVLGRITLYCAKTQLRWERSEEHDEGGNEQRSRGNEDKLGHLRQSLEAVSFLLSHARKAITPAQIARPSHVRVKLGEFNRVNGIPEILDSVRQDFEEVYRKIMARGDQGIARQVVNINEKQQAISLEIMEINKKQQEISVEISALTKLLLYMTTALIAIGVVSVVLDVLTSPSAMAWLENLVNR